MIDPVTLAVIQAGLQQVCDEMDLTFSRAAFSPVIAEADDRSDGIYSATDGSLIAQGSKGLPVFVGVMQFSTRTILERIAAGVTAAPEPGDIYIVNDPYLGGTHLMDVRFAMPVWRGARSSAGSPTPATGPTPAARCRVGFRPAPSARNRRGCASRR
jgi:N-methylhydantoinase B